MEDYPRSRLWLAADVTSLRQTEMLAFPLQDLIANVKIGLELTTAVGTMPAVRFLSGYGFNIFLDTKLCGTPNTIATAVSIIADSGVSMFTVAAHAGPRSVEAAARHKGKAKMLVSTVLTSVEESDVPSIGYWPPSVGRPSPPSIFDISSSMSRAALDLGADGFVCSGQELRAIDQLKFFESAYKLVTGIRQPDAPAHDHKRKISVGEAIIYGASAVVIGRPITDLPYGTAQRAVVLEFYEEISAALARRREFLESAQTL